MSTIATGIFKKVHFKKQSTQGTLATGGAATGQTIRRVTSTLDLSKASYRSNEIRPSQQRPNGRHGVRSVGGTISGELSVGTYQAFFESLLRAAAIAGVATTSLTTVTAAATTAPAGTFTRSSGSFLTDGFKVGDVVRWTGWSTTGVPNNAHNMIITALTATVMTCYPVDGVAIAAKAAGDSVTATVTGRKIKTPLTAHTRDYYTIEHEFADMVQSERFLDCVITQASIKLPATGIATVEFPIIGLNMSTGTSAYFTSPTAPTTTTPLAAVNGVIFVAGTKVGTVTSLEVNINGNHTVPGGVIGSNVDPDVFPGALDVSGTMTILFETVAVRDLFINETVFAATVVMTTDNTANSGFMAITMTSLIATGANKDDGEKGLTLTVPFMAGEDASGGTALSTDQTTLVIQDSAYA